MNILVCIKQVPETTDVKINPETNTLIREGVDSIVNPFDMYAIEMALRLRDAHGGKITVLSMGPPQAETALKTCVELGADDIYLVCDRAIAGSDTWATGCALSAAIKHIGNIDLVLCGKQAIDGDTAQVAAGIAEFLDWAYVGYVSSIEDVVDGVVHLHWATDYGHDKLECPTPAVMTILKEIGEPRLPSLKGKMKAKKAKAIMLTAADLNLDENDIGLKGSPTVVEKIFSPPQREGTAIVLEGEPADIAADLHTRLKEGMLI